ncbi:hypothetical protein N7462_010216 [Penicillium macrosclerotiorum]|uniref:uncharacterized protein n=1 Tax=Penicillium macrosclerotiorum TaxID=303699 RepID=UPI002547559A|nr:uncharacterized protein N7462_010216 [Penicillium macrosclerotiorum]KAJ5669146.1 hypothetical protein N7462_010216 [Penicillium macrosclerotiorum]
MSVPQASSTTGRNGTTNTALNQGNVSQVPRANQNNVNRFARAPAAEGPYYAGARIQDRSTHLNGLSNQVNAMDQILKN